MKPNGKVLVAGGVNGNAISTALASAELYDPATGTWSSTGSLATARFNHTATLSPTGQVLVAGGVSSSSAALASAELFSSSIP
jgi:N-acetylneuraminic acid mutarotase